MGCRGARVGKAPSATVWGEPATRGWLRRDTLKAREAEVARGDGTDPWPWSAHAIPSFLGSDDAHSPTDPDAAARPTAARPLHGSSHRPAKRKTDAIPVGKQAWARAYASQVLSVRRVIAW